MSFWIYFWIYTFSMIIIWGFFIIAKIHSLKFKSYQPKIVKITNLINIAMIILTTLWYVFIFMNYSWSNTYTLESISEYSWGIRNEVGNFNDISTEKETIRSDALDDYY